MTGSYRWSAGDPAGLHQLAGWTADGRLVLHRWPGALGEDVIALDPVTGHEEILATDADLFVGWGAGRNSVLIGRTWESSAAGIAEIPVT